MFRTLARKTYLWRVTTAPQFFKFCFVLVAFLTFSGCFTERSPKNPDENTSWVSPTEPTILLENLKKAFSSLDINNYRRCFLVERFNFQADPNILTNNIGLFSNWMWDNEYQYFINLTRAATPINNSNQLLFINSRIINHSTDSLEFTADYESSIYHQDTSFKAVSFAGLVSFQMKRNRQNEWQIVRWQDNKTKSNPCFSELRQHFFAR